MLDIDLAKIISEVTSGNFDPFLISLRTKSGQEFKNLTAYTPKRGAIRVCDDTTDTWIAVDAIESFSIEILP